VLQKSKQKQVEGTFREFKPDYGSKNKTAGKHLKSCDTAYIPADILVDM